LQPTGWFCHDAGSVEAGKLTEALTGFQQVVAMEEGKSEWCGFHRCGTVALPNDELHGSCIPELET
jgi:hypothetical protein